MKKIKTKKPISAEIASALLSCIYNNCCDILRDPECLRLFKQFEKYVDGLLDTGIDAPIKDTYLIIEQVSER